MQGRTGLPQRGAEEVIEKVALIDALRRPECYPHPVGVVELVETHISWVLLAGDYAYKLKKPVDFGFLDFSTLTARRHFCEEELRLNRRLAPQLYLDVVAITGSEAAPRIGGTGTALEYAVKMRRFRREGELDNLAERGALREEHVDALAATIARFHAQAQVAPPDGAFGTPQAALAPCIANFDQLSRLHLPAGMAARLQRLHQWTLDEHERRRALIARRLAQGRVRECHGDLHLGNIVLIDGTPTVFDALEFNPALRWIDVISEVAFTVMDLEHRGRHDFAQRFLDDYLAHSGDYTGVALLPFYLVYRALVRTKVAALRSRQPGDAEGHRHAEADTLEIERHLGLAERFAAPRSPRLLLTHGVSGSGKSHVAMRLLALGDWIRLRSDVERKRLAGLAAQSRGGCGIDTGLYTPEMTGRTYERLLALAEWVLDAGDPVIVDAAFLRDEQRRAFIALARAREVDWTILRTSAPEPVLRERIVRRAAQGADPSDATPEVLARQLCAIEPLSGDERDHEIVVDTSRPVDIEALARSLMRPHGPSDPAR